MLMRSAAQAQVAHALLLLSAIRLNQIPLDAFLKAWLQDKQERTFVTREQQDREMVRPTGPVTCIVEVIECSPRVLLCVVSFWMVQQRLKQMKLADLEQAAVYYVSVNEIKVRCRNLTLTQYAERFLNIPKGRADLIARQTRNLKVDSLSRYAMRIADELMVLGLRWQLYRRIEQLSAVATHFPAEMLAPGKEPPALKRTTTTVVVCACVMVRPDRGRFVGGGEQCRCRDRTRRLARS